MYNPMDIEHILEGNPGTFNPEYDKNRIFGAMILSYLPGIEKYGDNIPLVPDEPIPMRIVGVAWKRTTDGEQLIRSLASGIAWGTSMEVIRDPSEDMWVDPATNEFYAIDDLPKELEDKVVMAIGGKGEIEKPTVNFWGGGFTLTQADPTAIIHSLSASMSNKGVFTMTKNKPVAAAGNVVITTDGSSSGTTLKIGDSIIDWSHIWMSADKEEDRDYFNLEFTKDIDVGDGFVVTQRYHLKDNVIAKIEDNEGGSTMNNFSIAALKEELRKTDFKDYKSPDEVAGVVEAAKEEFKDFTSPDGLTEALKAEGEKVRKEVETELAKKFEVINQRIAEFEKTDLTVTKDRKEKIAEFKLEDDRGFKAYMDSEKSNYSAMEKVLKDKNVEISAEIKTKLAGYSGKDDPQFVSFIDGLSLVASSANTQSGLHFSVPAGGDADKTDFTGYHD